MFLDYVGSIVTGATIAMLLGGVVSSAVSQLGHRLVLAGVAGGWVGLAAAVTAKGGLAFIGTLPVLFMLPILAVVTCSIALPPFRTALFRIPVQLIIGLNTMRALGVLFLLLASANRLSGPFPYFAGIGDIVTGVFALGVASVAARRGAANWRVVAWNSFGTLDLLLAVFLALTSQNGSPLQLIHAGSGSAAIVTLPWSMIPLFLVPLYLVGHGMVFAHALRHGANERAVADQASRRSRAAGSTA